MRRRSSAGGKLASAQSRKAKTLKAGCQSSSTASSEETEVARLTRELQVAQEQQRATSAILGVVARSRIDVQSVLDTVCQSAASLCEAFDASIWRPDGSRFLLAAHHGPLNQIESVPLVRGSVLARSLLDKQSVHIADLQTQAHKFPVTRKNARRLGFRTGLFVPLIREDVAIGVIALRRAEARLFTERQVALLQTFADQAVIAIENARLLNELRESLEQQTATSDILKAISSSPGDLQPVFQNMLENAVRICEAQFGTLYLYQEGRLHFGAAHDVPPAFAEARGKSPFTPAPDTAIGGAVTRKKTVQVTDLAATQSYADRNPVVVIGVELAGVRTAFSVPMLKDADLVGVINIYRKEVRPFSDKQIALVENFAKQAVIAIENTRLLNELRQRTTDLAESLEQQTATADVLKIISSSPGGLEPVFQAMLENAVRICEAKFGSLFRFDGNMFRVAAQVGTPPELAEFQRRRGSFQPGPDTPFLDRVMRTKQVSHTADEAAEVVSGPAAKLGGARSLVGVPMLKDDELVGALIIYRQEVRPFTDKQIELLKNFAAQAVIAIENTRLLNELRESLQQQTATAEVLRVISSSPGELEPVFQNLLSNARRLCAADFGLMFQYDGTSFQLMAQLGADPGFVGYLQRGPFRPGPESLTGRVLRSRGPVQIEDFAKSKGYLDRDPLAVMAVEKGGIRTNIGVPLLRENELIGVISLYRQEVRLFTDKQIELLQNFAAQAVIAIENARLLNELRQSLEQQIATADVLRVISSSPGELEPVFQAMLENAVRICDAAFGNLMLYDGEAFRFAALHGARPEWEEVARREPVLRVRPNSPLGRVAASKQLNHIEDIRKEQAFIEGQSATVALAELAGARTLLNVPMLKEKELIGTLSIYRSEVRPFTERQINLVQNFADQAVIAIENTRLLNELRQRTDDLSEALEQQTATSEVLKVISSSPGSLQPVFDAMLKNATDLCGAGFASLRLREEDQFRTVSLYNAPAALVEHWRSTPLVRPHPESALGRAALTKQVIQIDDVKKGAAYSKRDPLSVAGADLGGYLTVLAVPMVREDVLVGVISIYRQEVRPFTEKQIELVKSFAAQAVIAIENARLLSELRESLEQQTATSEVLGVISRSPTNVQPVFDSIAESAVRLCDGQFSFMVRFNGQAMDFASSYGLSAEGLDAFRRLLPQPASNGTASGRAILDREIVEIPDVAADPAYGVQGLAQTVTYRSIVAVPLLHEGNPIGAIAVARANAGSFPERQIALLQAFADQAAIAIRNVRLFDEVQARSRELSESLEQQTATAKVLEVISRAAFDLKAVFETVVESSVRLCGADRAFIFRFDGELLRMAVAYNAPQQLKDFISKNPFSPGRDSTTARAALERRSVHIPDVQADPEYTFGTKNIDNLRTTLAVPILKGDDLLGVLTIYHLEQVRPFTDKQIALVETFADQAAIAIDNSRLLDELRHRTDELGRTVGELQALGEVSQAVNSTLDLETVLSTIVAKAVQLSGTEAGAIYGYDEQWREFRLQAPPTAWIKP